MKKLISIDFSTKPNHPQLSSNWPAINIAMLESLVHFRLYLIKSKGYRAQGRDSLAIKAEIAVEIMLQTSNEILFTI